MSETRGVGGRGRSVGAIVRVGVPCRGGVGEVGGGRGVRGAGARTAARRRAVAAAVRHDLVV